MSAIETCRTAALGGHVEGCEDCGHRRIAYNSCRNRHCPKCQGAAAREWLAAREADLLPVGYFHVVFTLPAEIADIAFHNKAAVYDLLFRAAAETMLTIAADPRHLGARIGVTAVLHTWGSAMTHHPHIHMIVPGGGISLDGERWISSRAGLPAAGSRARQAVPAAVPARLQQLHAAGRLRFFGDQVGLNDSRAFLRHLAPLRKKRWVVYAKPPFSGPEAVLAYLSRYTHRVAISNRRLIAFDEAGVTFRYKDYRRDAAERQRTMTLSPDEFIRRFLLHVLPKGFHRIRHYGLLASAGRKANIARARELLDVPAPPEAEDTAPTPEPDPRPPCPCCGGRMIIIEIFRRAARARAPPSSPCPYRGCCVVTRHDKPRPTSQAAVLRPPGEGVPAAITGSLTVRITVRSDRPAPSPQVDGKPVDRFLRPTLPSAGASRSPRQPQRPSRHPLRNSKFSKSP